MLNDLAAQDGATAFKRRLHTYCTPKLLVVDEVGYLSYDTRYADLLFEVVTQRYTERSIVLTTNKPFSEWNDVFPNASCVVTLVDRLVHKSEIVAIRAESYRLKEAKEHAAEKAKNRRDRQPKARPSGKTVTE
jgi:DNA replication protein DnaC